MCYHPTVTVTSTPFAVRDDRGRVLRLVPGTLRAVGQADVWRGEPPDGRAVAVKIYRDDNAAAARERAMLEDVAGRDPEAGAWLIRLLRHGSHDGRAFLVLEWMPETLASWCAARPLPARVIALERAVARGAGGEGAAGVGRPPQVPSREIQYNGSRRPWAIASMTTPSVPTSYTMR